MRGSERHWMRNVAVVLSIVVSISSGCDDVSEPVSDIGPETGPRMEVGPRDSAAEVAPPEVGTTEVSPPPDAGSTTPTALPTDPIMVNADGRLAAQVGPGTLAAVAVAGSSESLIYDAELGMTGPMFGFQEVVIPFTLTDGSPAFIFGLPRLKMSVVEAGFFVEPVEFSSLVPEAMDSPLEGVLDAYLSDNSVVRFTESGGTMAEDWLTDASFTAACPGSPAGIATTASHGLLLSSFGNLCHYQVGTTTPAALVIDLSMTSRDLSCPRDADGDPAACLVVTESMALPYVWSDVTVPPTAVGMVDICDGARSVSGIMSADGTQSCFAINCFDDDVLDVVCLDNGDGSLVDHRRLDNASCNGQHAYMVTDDQVIDGCTTYIGIHSVSTDFTPVP